MSTNEPGGGRPARRASPESGPVTVRIEPRALRRGVITVLVLLAGYQLVLWAETVLGQFLFLLLLAWLLSIAMEPAVAWFANHGMRRGAATGLVALMLFVVAIGFLFVFGSLFFSQLAQLISGLPDYISQLVVWLNSTFHLNLDPTTVLETLKISPGQLAGVASNFAGGVLGVLGVVFGALFDALTVFVFAFYFSADGPRLRRAIGSWLPLEYQKVFVTVWDIAVTKTGGFVVSKVVLAAISAFFHCGFFYLINVPYWLPMGIFAGIVSQFIPTIGTYIGVVIPAVFAAFAQPIDAVWIIIFATVYQQVESYVFTPRVSRATMDIHPAIALGSVFVGFAIFGPIGAIIGIPLAAAVIAVIETYAERYELVPELRARTKGEKPAKAGDAFGGDPAHVIPAGKQLSTLVQDEDEDARDAGPTAARTPPAT